MVKAFNPRKPGHLARSLLLGESWSRFIRSLMIGQTASSRSLRILGV